MSYDQQQGYYDPNFQQNPNFQQDPNYPQDPNFQQNYQQNPNYQQGYDQNFQQNQPLYQQPIQQDPYANTIKEATNFLNNPLAQAGLSYAPQLINRESVEKYVSVSSLRYYFSVDNSYVFNKLKLLLFPVLHKSWKRRTYRVNDSEEYLPPRDDINAPDLYIPVMAFVTYVLIVAFVMGTAYQFTPEVLGMTASTGLVALLLEVLTIKLGFYILGASTISIYDIFAYSGYKYVGLVLQIFIGYLFGSIGYYCSTILFGAFMGLFMIKTLKVASPDSGVEFANSTHNTKNYFLLFIAALQIVQFLFLGSTGPANIPSSEPFEY